jgi:ligand-binding sensor domain-containing protein/signal transduction histidine kinase
VVGVAIAIAASAAVALRAERVPFLVYNVSHGLAHDRIRCVLADSVGFLWLCTADGLSRFDGRRFINYGSAHGLPHPEVSAIVEAGAGVYWVGTVGGLARLGPDSSGPKAVAPGARHKSSAGAHDPPVVSFTALSLGSVADNHVFALKVDRGGRLWVGTAGGLFVLDHPLADLRVRRIEPDGPTASFGQVRALAEGPDGTLWVGTLAGLFRRLPDGRIVRDPMVAPTDEVRRLLIDRSGRMWASSLHGLILAVPARLGASTSTWSPTAVLPRCRAASSASSLPSLPGEACRFDPLLQPPATVRSLWEGRDGHVWIGTTGGLVEFDGGIRTYSTRHGLSDDTVTAVAEDRAGHLWVGTDAGGVARLMRNGFVSYGEADGLRHGYVTSISQRRTGRLRASGGWPVLNEFDGQRFRSGEFRIPGEVDAGGLFDVFEDHTGDVWVGTPNGLLRFPARASVAQFASARPTWRYSAATGLPATRVAPVFEDSHGDLWMTAHLGADGRAVRWERSTGHFHQYPETDARLGALRDHVFAEDAARTVWLGSSRGLARLHDGRFDDVTIGVVRSTIAVTALHRDQRGRLWVATRGHGLYRSDDPAAARPSFTAYTVAEGLSSGTVWCLTDDRAGDLYAGTARGVDRLHPESGHITHYSVADGLAGSEVITAFRASDGTLWFGTFEGISRLTVQPPVARDPPTVWIGELRIRGAAQALGLLGQSQVVMRTLAPEQNHVQIDYFGLSSAPGDQLTYQYVLEGTGAGWSAPGPERSVTYAELAPGSYRFLVRAVGEAGDASPRPASVTFTILAPIWQRGWFLATLALTAVASAYAIHRSRMTRLLEMERLRTRIASDLHDDVGSSLTQVSILSEIVRTRLINPGDLIADALSRIGTLSRESVDSMSDIVWAIDPARDTPAHLLQRMRRVAYELLGSAGIQLEFTSPGDASPRLPADVRRHVFLMFKEILNNTVRHGDATVVHVEVTVAMREVRVAVTDDGCGFDTAAAAEGQGLRSLERRATSLGGSLQVTSSPGRGTRVIFTVPVLH